MLKKNLPLVAVFVVALAVGVYFITSSGQEDEMAAMPEKTETSVEATEPASQSGSGPIEMVLGDANAPITVIEYASHTVRIVQAFTEKLTSRSKRIMLIQER